MRATGKMENMKELEFSPQLMELNTRVTGFKESIMGWACSFGRMGQVTKANGSTAKRTAKGNSLEPLALSTRESGRMASFMEEVSLSPPMGRCLQASSSMEILFPDPDFL